MSTDSTFVLTEQQNREITSELNKEEKKLLGFIRRRVRTDEDAQDIMQDVFYQFVRMYRNLDQIEKTKAWLYRVARNKITDLYRKQTEERINPFHDDEGLTLSDILPDLNSANPEDQFTNELVWEVLEEGLNELPEEQRFAFVQHELEGFSFNEIADVTGESVNTLITRKRYAVLYLREKLDELFNEIKFK